MMNLLDRKFLRDLGQIRGRMLGLVLIIAAGVGIFFGIRLALSNLLTTQEQLLDQARFADLEVQLLPEDRRNLPDLASLPMVEAVESRLVFPGFIELADKGPLTTYMIFQDSPQPQLNRLTVIAGRLTRPGLNEVVIDRSLADFHVYRPGDPIEIRLGRQVYKRTVAGVVMSPEFLVTSSNPDYVVAEPGSLGVVWGDLADLRQNLGFTMVNSLLLRLKPGTDADQGLRAVAEAVHRLNVERIVPRNESYSTKQVRMELNAFGIYTPAIIVTLLVLALAMGFISFRRFAVERRRELAVLLSLGLGRRTILVSLLRMGLLLGLLGGIVGLALGWVTSGGIAHAYAQAMKLPMVIRTFETGLAIQALLLGLASGGLAAVASCRPLLGKMPRELLTEGSAPPAESKQPALGRWPLLLRFSLRDLWQQWELGLAAIGAMGGAIGVAISYGLAMTSNFDTVGESFQQDRWDYAVDFRYPLYLDEAEQMLTAAGVKGIQPYFRSSTELRSMNGHAIGILSGQSPGNLHSQRTSAGRPVQEDGEAVVSQDLLRTLGARVGDELTLEKGNQHLPIKVVGATNDIFLQTVTVTLKDAQVLAQFDEKASGCYVAADGAARRRLSDEGESVARVTDRRQLYDSLMRQMDEKMGIVYITIVFAIGVSILIVTTLVHLSIAERKGEYATLLSLGLGRRRLRTIILGGVAAQLALALLLSIPVGLLLVHALNARMGEAWYAVDAHYSLKDFLIPMAASLLVAPLAALFGVRAVLRLNIPDYLRGRAI